MQLAKSHKATIRKRANMQKVEEWWLDGITNQRQMGEWLGVSQGQVSVYMKQIRQNWASEDAETCKANRQRHIRAQYRIVRKAVNEFEVSKTEKTWIDCSSCKGKGWVPKNGVCGSCQGEGKIEIEVRVPGDPKYLRVMQDGIKEIAKLDASYPEEVYQRPRGDKHLHLHEGPKVSVFAAASNEQLLDVRERLEEVKAAIGRNGDRKAIIEVESEAVEINEGNG